jgi:hypothetical protein
MSTKVLTVVSLAAGAAAMAIAPSSAATGSGANGCYLVLPASHQGDGSGTGLTSRIEVDNPASVTLAADCAGAALSVEDVLTIQTSRPNGGGGMLAQDFANDHCRGDATLPPINVTGLFRSGAHSVTVSTAKDWNCPGPTSNPNIYLIVSYGGPDVGARQRVG